MRNLPIDEAVRAAAEAAQPLRAPKDLASLIERLKDARVVMLGEASHGTHEFYEWRRLISEWLVVKHGFRFIAVEGDWPDCQAIDRYVRRGEGGSAREAIGAFRRWPTWMWANTEVVRLAEWVRQHNVSAGGRDRGVGFHGLDVYSLFDSMAVVIERLERINPFLARRAKRRYACFEPYGGDERAYARALLELSEGCERQVAEALQELLELKLARAAEPVDELLDAEQNARVVANAERYYRAMMKADDQSWNVRDRHMLETLETLLRSYGPQAKGIVWAHNTHVGDHRHTSMAEAGLVNLGGLARQKLGEGGVAIVGFGTHRGSVVASRSWEGPIEVKEVPPGKPGTYEDALHQAALRIGSPALTLVFGRDLRQGPLAKYRGQRAIGVVYEPVHERYSSYVPTSLARRYDAFVFIDETRALDPIIQPFEPAEIPETWPIGQ